MSEKYDQVLLGILQNEGKIVNFLEAMFNFLYRRTDFYILMDPEDKHAKLGFPKGIAESMVYESFKKFQLLSAERQHNNPTAPRPVAPMDTNSEKRDPSRPEKKPDPKPKKKANPKPKEEPKPADVVPETTKADPSGDDEEVVISGKVASSDRPYQADAECYNGAARDAYTWSQTITDLDVNVHVSETTLKARDVDVSLERKHLKVRVKKEDDDWTTLVDGELTWEINKEESMWSLHPGQHIHVNMEKIQERWWEAVLEGEDRINIRKIDASRPVTDLGDEEQAKIQEMMFNETQKRLGLPQSHEQKVHDVLKQAWDKEGSPFRGQPFDPSSVQIAPNNQLPG